MSRGAAIRLRPRSLAAVVIASAIGLMAFLWPLVLTPAPGATGGGTAPLLFALLLPVVLGVVLVEMSDGGMDVKAIALLGVLAAVGAVLRPMGAGAAGLETVFFLLVLAGRVFGAGFGFALGAITLFASALLTAGIGPWLPYQMLGAAWVGLGAGLLPPAKGRLEVAMLAAYGAVAGLLYGVALNFSFWPFSTQGEAALTFVPGAPVTENLTRFLTFTLTTSVGWDLGRALTNAVLILITGRSVLGALRRASRRAAFEAPVRFVDTARAAEHR
ncbi:ECF transporter S component [Janibacter sp. G56]|uniref:ECF transporter S component n=1 Tax=Janibacter sp. G56 TaxID=3418717 RepID=UPI003D033CD1